MKSKYPTSFLMANDMNSQIIEIQIIDARIMEASGQFDLLFSARLINGLEREFRALYIPYPNSALQYEVEVEFPLESDIFQGCIHLDNAYDGGQLKMVTALEELPAVLDSQQVINGWAEPMGPAQPMEQSSPLMSSISNKWDQCDRPACAPGNITSQVRQGTLYVQVNYSMNTGPVAGSLQIYVSNFMTTTITNYTDYPSQNMVEFDCGANSNQPHGATYQVYLSDNSGPCPAYPDPAGSWPPPVL